MKSTFYLTAILLTGCINKQENEDKNSLVRITTKEMEDGSSHTSFFSNSNDADSIYLFEPVDDSLIHTSTYIYNQIQVRKELSIKFDATDSGRVIRYTLIDPRYQWISLYLLQNKESIVTDSLIINEASLNQLSPDKRIITISVPEDKYLEGYVLDSKMIALGDTIGSKGIVFDRYLHFEINR